MSLRCPEWNNFTESFYDGHVHLCEGGRRQSVLCIPAGLEAWLVGYYFLLKYADYALEKLPHLHTVASSCYYLGRRKKG